MVEITEAVAVFVKVRAFIFGIFLNHGTPCLNLVLRTFG